jgi:YD repeat-containing protein
VTATGPGQPSYSLSYAQDLNGIPITNRIDNPGYSYDQCGNPTSDGELTFTYDAAGRLKTASMLDSVYDYDGDGRRVRQGNSTGTVHYLWSSVLGEPVVELDGSGGV